MSSIDSLLKFVEMTHQLQQVKRGLYVRGEDRKENDFEHHYQLAITTWYLANAQKLDLDVNKVIQYALIHDVVEVYAGDTDAFTGDKSTKAMREAEAAEKLKKEFPEFYDLHELIERYEKREDEESKFVYALDKIIPTINNFLDDGRTWRERGITFDMVINDKKGKIAQSSDVEKLFSELIKKIEPDQKKLFGKANGKVKKIVTD